MRLLFIRSALNPTPPTDPDPIFPVVAAASWSYPTPNQIYVSWDPITEPLHTVILTIRMLDDLGGLKGRRFTVPIASLPYTDSTYTITNPSGRRCWVGLTCVHNVQGHCGYLVVFPIDRGGA
jgi:hypothetical protein